MDTFLESFVGWKMLLIRFDYVSSGPIIGGSKMNVKATAVHLRVVTI